MILFIGVNDTQVVNNLIAVNDVLGNYTLKLKKMMDNNQKVNQLNNQKINQVINQMMNNQLSRKVRKRRKVRKQFKIIKEIKLIIKESKYSTWVKLMKLLLKPINIQVRYGDK